METLRSWDCSDCGRSNTAVAALDAAGRCKYCAALNTLSDDATKRQALGRLRDRYREARKLVSSRKPYANLEWVLAAMKNTDRTASYWADRTIELVALWLEDLSAEIDRLFPQEVTGEIGEGVLSAYRAHRALAQGLRDATKGFVGAFRHSAGPGGLELAESNGLGIPVLSVFAAEPYRSTPSLSQEDGLAPGVQSMNQRLSAGIAISQRLRTSGSGPESSPCVMCDHERAVHTAGTDGAGWCGQGRACECGGFQEWRSPGRGLTEKLTVQVTPRFTAA
jgi:hypothetical protein